MALFSEHCKPEELAGLFKCCHGIAVGYIADVNAVDLLGQQRCRLQIDF